MTCQTIPKLALTAGPEHDAPCPATTGRDCLARPGLDMTRLAKPRHDCRSTSTVRLIVPERAPPSPAPPFRTRPRLPRRRPAHPRLASPRLASTDTSCHASPRDASPNPTPTAAPRLLCDYLREVKYPRSMQIASTAINTIKMFRKASVLIIGFLGKLVSSVENIGQWK